MSQYVAGIATELQSFLGLSLCMHVCSLRHLTPNFGQQFFPSSHLCLVVYMCLTLICDTIFFLSEGKKSDDR